jgi:flagellar motor switch protein FliG
VPEALRNFVESIDRVGGEAAVGDDLLRDVAARALGSDVARRAFDGVMPPAPPDEVLGPISQADPEALAMVLQREQPQTIALVLSSVDCERAAAVMEHMPEERRVAVLRRMVQVESVSPEVLREVGAALAGELRAALAGGMRRVDGKSAALEILRRSNPQLQGQVVAGIEGDNPELAGELKTRLFTFDDLRHLSDRDLQSLLKDVDLGRLAVALKGATEESKARFLKNLSSRAGEMLRDDIASMAPVKISVVEKAQEEIAAAALALSADGKITIVGPSDKLV